MSKQEQIEKIQKLLILAHDNTNRAEGDAAKKKADDLMKKHDISMSEMFGNYSDVEKTVSVHDGKKMEEQRMEDVDEDTFEKQLNIACDDEGLVGDRRREAKKYARSRRNDAIRLRRIRIREEWERIHPEEYRKQRDQEEKQRKEWQRVERIEKRRQLIFDLPGKMFGWTLGLSFAAAIAWFFTYVWREYRWASISNVILGKFINLALYALLASALIWICMRFVRMLYRLFNKLKK